MKMLDFPVYRKLVFNVYNIHQKPPRPIDTSFPSSPMPAKRNTFVCNCITR